MEFEHDFPSAKVVRLEQNYRSTKRILAAAGALIKANTERKEKELWTENVLGEPIRVVEREDAEEEADFLVDEVNQHRDQGGALSDIAVFYRIDVADQADLLQPLGERALRIVLHEISRC